jgi:hypothetical protein
VSISSTSVPCSFSFLQTPADSVFSSTDSYLSSLSPNPSPSRCLDRELLTMTSSATSSSQLQLYPRDRGPKDSENRCLSLLLHDHGPTSTAQDDSITSMSPTSLHPTLPPVLIRPGGGAHAGGERVAIVGWLREGIMG